MCIRDRCWVCLGERARIIGTQQSEMIAQRQNDELPKNFGSAGFDSLGGFGLEQFEPR